MAAKWIELVTGSLEQKKQYKQSKARLDALPEPYHSVANAFNRYFMYYGGVTDGDTIVQMFSDLADLWERAAIDGTPVSEIVGEDPIEFAESFAQAYGGKRWIDKERARLNEAVDKAAGVGAALADEEFASVAEGEDKPLKYPLMFRACELVLINKIDLLPHLDYDLDRLLYNIDQVHPDAERIVLSARTGEGIDVWREWLMGVGARREVAAAG